MEKEMKITVLIDNIARAGLICEWGLSFFIEFENHCFLLDMGTTGDFAVNAADLGIDLSRVDFSILSHAHYDHSDGMGVFFEKNDHAKLYIREGAGENCYGLNDEGETYYIGIKEGSLEKYKDRIVYAGGDYRICENVYLIPHKTPGLDAIGRKVGMKIRTGDGWKIDDFSHEQSLVFRTDKGLVIFNSCSHGAPQNIMKEVCASFPGEKVHAYLGGLHQYRSTPEEVRSLAQLLKDMNVDHIYTGHCTGDAAYAILKEELGEKIDQFCSGYQIDM